MKNQTELVGLIQQGRTSSSHRNVICSRHDIPPKLNVFDMIMMPDQDKKKYVSLAFAASTLST
jgi:hypothetical protein